MRPMPTFRQLPGPIYFRFGTMPPSIFEPHTHPWGLLNYVSQGLMELAIGGKRMVSPPQYGIWIPPGVEHASVNRTALEYRSAYVAPDIAARLPAQTCAVSISEVLKVLLDEFARLDVTVPHEPAHRRMARVVIDQILNCEPVASFLPSSDEPHLAGAMAYARKHIARGDSVRDIADARHMSVRTLERLAQSELGIGFGEWRQRLRFTLGVELLGKGRRIEAIARDLGYANASSFIEMFKRQAGCTPDQFRKGMMVPSQGD
ncbi:MAG: HTH-type transcriptional regulator NimR [Luteibacter sp.]|uniref:AraC family transcriptional regulator n=1 Tax=Luteibacter sp. TaxID=1886636 RepID=UPI00137FC444|nr:helix-turn-helix transcriptional regulator [Luteibacter sp.]KAF1006180.1 MAG: HTH-type transcriptional regulator NimR [Luteibacter sp.]